MYKYLAMVVLSCLRLQAQDFEPLIHKAWEHNAQLRAGGFALKAAEAQWRAAKSMFGPVASFGMQYTLATGGRSFSFPVGDLLNPVYSTLNQLTGTTDFPQIANVEEQFLPDNFYDARLRLTQPIYYPDLALQRDLRHGAIMLKAAELRAFKRLISKDVMQAVTNVRTARTALEIYASTGLQLREAARMTQSLVRQGAVLPTALSRLEGEMATVEAERAEGVTQLDNGLAYLEFLTGLTRDQIDVNFIEEGAYPPEIVQNTGRREELEQLEYSIRMQQTAVRREKQFHLPRLAAVADLGSQDFDFALSPYAMLGLNLEFSLYDHRAHRHRRSAAEAESQQLIAQKEHAEAQIDLQVRMALNGFYTASEQARMLETPVRSAEANHRDVMNRYREGVATYLELLDAQENLKRTRLQHALALQNAWMKWADATYASAAFPIE
ncbi:MAG: TolC family protein [Saprospiraceae bacterium]|nr:TolC family protein [Saprospiraceae bacterium]